MRYPRYPPVFPRLLSSRSQSVAVFKKCRLADPSSVGIWHYRTVQLQLPYESQDEVQVGLERSSLSQRRGYGRLTLRMFIAAEREKASLLSNGGTPLQRLLLLSLFISIIIIQSKKTVRASELCIGVKCLSLGVFL